MVNEVFLSNDWKEHLKDEFNQPYYRKLQAFLLEESAQSKIYPEQPQVFRALNECAFKETRVVILGQDPYHGPNQAHGLCFSVNEGIKIPPSLRNIFKELNSDIGCKIPHSGDLSSWCAQGVLLLNATLTVRAAEAGSHQKKGWEIFTDTIIQRISEQRKDLVFLLWGAYAQKKGAFINNEKHLVLQAAHPSPFSAHKGFFGCRHFSQANEYLIQHGRQPVQWCLE